MLGYPLQSLRVSFDVSLKEAKKRLERRIILLYPHGSRPPDDGLATVDLPIQGVAGTDL